ncbi:MAG: HXXEE domain-containing protein [Pseudomonadota bacterium]
MGAQTDGKKNSTLQLTVVALFFAMLWTPLGQSAFLIEHWMRLGTFMAPILVLALTLDVRGIRSVEARRVWAVVFLLAYIGHQFEEHWIDVTGNLYSFYAYVNELIASIMQMSGDVEPPLTESAIFFINTSLVWLVGFLAIVLGSRQPFTVHAMMAISFINAISHIGASVLKWSYNPGLLTSILLFLPLSSAYIVHTIRREPWERRSLLGSIIWALLAHILMVGGLILANIYGYISERAYFVMLIGWSLVPSVITFTLPRRNTPLSARAGRS